MFLLFALLLSRRVVRHASLWDLARAATRPKIIYSFYILVAFQYLWFPCFKKSTDHEVHLSKDSAKSKHLFLKNMIIYYFFMTCQQRLERTVTFKLITFDFPFPPFQTKKTRSTLCNQQENQGSNDIPSSRLDFPAFQGYEWFQTNFWRQYWANKHLKCNENRQRLRFHTLINYLFRLTYKESYY